MGEHEVELGAKFGLPEIHGFAAHVEARYRGTWQTRRRALAAAIEKTSGLSAEEVEARLDADEGVRDVLWRALERVDEVGDPVYVDALGRLVGRALDPAVIEEAGFIASELTRLEPAHLRALFAFWDYGREGVAEATEGLGPTDAAWAHARRRSERELARELRLTRASAGQVILRLDREGLIVRGAGPVNSAGETVNSVADWGGEVMGFLFPRLYVEIVDPPQRPSGFLG